jgi:hypothetical protein
MWSTCFDKSKQNALLFFLATTNKDNINVKASKANVFLFIIHCNTDTHTHGLFFVFFLLSNTYLFYKIRYVIAQSQIRNNLYVSSNNKRVAFDAPEQESTKKP